MRRAKAGQLEPVLLVAEHQTAGRGRLGRTWHDEGGKRGAPSVLMFSLGLSICPQDWSGLSLAVGLSVAESLHPDLRLKWPNDLWWQERKLAGILIETMALAGDSGDGGQGGVGGAPNRARYAVIGIGINIQPRTREGLATAPAWLQELSPDINAATALQRIALNLVRTVQQFEQTGFVPFRARFSQRDALAGRLVNLSDGTEGRALGVDENGALTVQTAAGMVKITSSEISVRPQAAGASPTATSI